ncbi:MAG TPA: AI-2E family transporter [Vicinamibacterales bacterium]|nr:AI-2E family transporter [Vicinamibacterales bacterium]
MTITPWQPPSQARAVLQVIAAVAVMAAGLWLLYRLEKVAFLLVLTTFFAYLVAPFVRVAERPVRVAGTERRLPRALAIAVVYLSMTAVAAAGTALLLPTVTQQVSEAAALAPAYAESLRAREQRWARYYDRMKVPIELRRGIDRSLVAAGDAGMGYARGAVMNIAGSLSYVPWLVLIPVLAFFLLKDAQLFRRLAITMLPLRFRLRGRRLCDDLNATVAAYVRGQLVSCALVGVLCGVAFAVLGLPYATLLGILAGVLEFVPLVGPLVIAVAATMVAALTAPVLAVWVVAFLAVLRVVQDYAIYPRLVGRGLQLHPLAIIVAVLAGLELGGVAGIFLAVPVVAVASVVYRHCVDWREGDRLGDDAVLHVAVKE